MKKTLLLLYFCIINYAVFATATLGNAGGTAAAGTMCVPATKYIVAEFTIAQTVANTTLNTINFTTTGTYVAADMTDFKLYGNVSNTFGTAVQIGTTIVAGLGVGAHSFTALGIPLISGQTEYFWIVADAPATATACNTLTVSAFTNANIVVAAGGTAGATALSGTQTINKVPVVTASAAPASLCVGANLTLTGTGVACNNYTWAGPGGYTAATQNPPAFAVAATNAGIFTLTATNLCGTTTANTAAVVVNPIPTGVTASATPNPVCIGSNLTLTGTATGAATYLWTGPGGSGYSSALLAPPAFAATALDAGVFTFKATTALGCFVTVTTAAVVVSNTPPAAITGGPAAICAGNTVALNDASALGVWSSSLPLAASVTAAGLVTGIAPGVATISYSIGGCAATTTVTVNENPPAPVVAPHFVTICNNGNVTITSTEPATPASVLTQTFNTGTAPWTIDNTGSIATVGGTGWRACGDGYINELGTYHSLDNSGFTMVNADTSGAASTTISTITSPTFSLAGYTSATITYNVAFLYYAPGDHNVELDISSDGGATWSVVKDYVAAAASVGSTAGFVNQTFSLNAYLGLPNLMARFYYNSTFGWYFAVDNVAITGVAMPLATTWSPVTDLFTDAAFTVPYVAGTPASTVYAHPTTVMALTTTTYVATNTFGTCTAVDSSQVTINPNPLPIVGTASACVGTTTPLSDPTMGGSWSSSDITIATVDAVTGLVTGVAVGNATISYTVGACSSTIIVTVNVFSSPGIISGQSNICVGSTATLLDGVAGGTWSVSNANATVSATGVVTGVSIGIDTVYYTLATACGLSLTNFTDTISAAANAGFVVGPTTVCAGSFAILTDTVAGGVWSSSNATGTISATGLFSAVSAGVDTLSYTVTTSCSTSVATKIITVMPLPDTGVVSGTSIVCVGSTVNLTETLAGGTWGVTNANATISGAGVVTGVTAGIDTILYTETNACGSLSATFPVTINAIGASAITGPTTVCVGAVVNLTDATPGGVFSSGNLNATITSGGALTGALPGVDTITYTIIDICGAYNTTTVITVEPLPNAGAITGANTVCVNASITLTESVAGGVWSSASTAIATVDSTTGVVTGVSGAAVNINYLVTSAFGCVSEASYSVTVNPAPFVNPISGTFINCLGASTTFTDATLLGTWSSSNSAIATIDPSTGISNCVGVGIATISYSITDALGCIGSAVANDTVNTIPVQSPITGTPQVCVGGTTTLANSIPTGTWSSLDNTLATIDPVSGVVTGISAGNTSIVYTVINNCGATADTASISVNANPVVAPISGPVGNVCAGAATLLTDATTGGVWSSNNTSIATINSSTGMLTGLAAGLDTVVYTVTNASSCSLSASYVVTFGGFLSANLMPAGSASLCHNANVHLFVTSSGSGLTYQWVKDGSIITGATSYAYNATVAGDYTAIVSNSTCTETLPTTLVSAAPTPVISFSTPNVLYTGSYLAYQWLLNGAVIPGANSSIYLVTRNGTYNVVVSDAYGCSDTSGIYIIGDIVNSVKNVASSNDVYYYPNPATSILKIDAPVTVNVNVLSPDGKIVISEKAVKEININSLANGMYMIMIYNQDNTLLQVGKFTKF